MEFLRYPDFTVLLALKDERSHGIFDEFTLAIKCVQANFQPVLGLHNCPAELYFKAEGEVHEHEGKFETFGFLLSSYQPILPFPRLSFDRIATYQTNDFWNLPERYVSVVFPSNGQSVKASGKFYQFKESQWCLT